MDLIEVYKSTPIKDLREDLRRVRQLNMLVIDDIPDDTVRLFHMLVTLGADQDAPDWFKKLATFAINAQRNGEIDHQLRREQDAKLIGELRARLGEDVYENFFANAI